jgi:hypothetical protein
VSVGAAGRPRPRWRRAGRWLAALLGLLVLAAITLPLWLDASRVAVIVLGEARKATDLDWRIDGEPQLRWRPTLWLRLPGLTAHDREGARLLRAERLDVAVPWSTLRGGALQVSALELEAPDIDVEATWRWWQAQPDTPGHPLPQLEGLELKRGTLRWPGQQISGFDLRLPRFVPGEASRLTASGQWHAPERAPMPFALVLAAVPEDAPLRFESVHLDLEGEGLVPRLRAAGRLQTSPWQLKLEGVMADWPEAWPPLPSPLSGSAEPISIQWHQDGKDALQAESRLKVSRGEARFEARGQVQGLERWWATRNDPEVRLPPVAGQVSLPRLELDGVRIEGLRLEVSETAEAGDAPPKSEP